MFLTYTLASFPVFLHRKNQRDESEALVPKIVGCSSSPIEKGRKPEACLSYKFCLPGFAICLFFGEPEPEHGGKQVEGQKRYERHSL